MAYSLSSLRAAKSRLRKLESRKVKEEKKTPKGAMAAHLKACRISHYESQIAVARERVKEVESNLTGRSAKKRSAELERAEKAKTRAVASVEKYRKQKEAAEKEAKKTVEKVKKEAKKAVAKVKKEAKAKVEKVKKERKPRVKKEPKAKTERKSRASRTVPSAKAIKAGADAAWAGKPKRKGANANWLIGYEQAMSVGAPGDSFIVPKPKKSRAKKSPKE